MQNNEGGEIAAVEEQYRYKFLWRGRLFLAYNKGFTKYGDFYKSKPDFEPVLTPSGREVTTTAAHRYNHHHSIWIGHAKINGVNVFHDNNPERANLGDIVLEDAALEYIDVPAALQGAAGTVRLRTTNGWIAKNGRRLCTEHRTMAVTAAAYGGRAHVVDIDSDLLASEGEIVLEQDTHAYLGVRVADSMDEEDGGMIRNSNGQTNEAECMRQEAVWCDYSGEVAGQPAGVTMLVHPENPPTAFFTRAYGTFLANPTLLGSMTVPAGDHLRQRFRLLIHDGAWQPTEIDAAYRAYAE